MPRTRSRHQAKRYYSPERRKGKGWLPPKPFRSWLEADIAHDLKKRKVEYEYEEDTLIYVIPAIPHRYKPDFRLPNGIIVEAKGRWKSEDRKKMGYVIEQNPHEDIRMLFASDNKISKNSRTRYSDWCEKRGIKYAIGKQVPEEWINE